MPIVVFVSRPDTDEAYWVSIRDYFKDPARRVTRKIVFDPVLNRFDHDAYAHLRDVAVSKAGGTYLVPTPKPEIVFSNLLEIDRLPSRVFHAYTEHGGVRAFREALVNAGGNDPQEWAYRGKQIISVHDLSEPPWRHVCDRGTWRISM